MAAQETRASASSPSRGSVSRYCGGTERGTPHVDAPYQALPHEGVD